MMKTISEVIVWGVGKDTEKYVDYLREAKIGVRHFVDLYKGGHVFCGQTVLTPQKFKRDFFSSSRLLPIVVTSKNNSGLERFEETADYIVNTLGLVGARILHPAFLIDYLNFSYSGRAVTVGFPRTGNWLLKFILLKLLEKNSEQKGEKEVFFETLAMNHYNMLVNTFNGAFTFAKPQVMNLFSIHKNRLSCFSCKQSAFMHFSGPETRWFLTQRFYHSHDTPDALETFNNMGYKVFVPVRNPLDVIVSFAFKFVLTIISMEPEMDLNKTESPFREIYGKIRMSNLEWFEQMAKRTKDYYETFLDRKADVDPYIVKYEEIISRPVDVICRLADSLGVECTEEEARAVWNEYGFKPLMPGEKTHIFRPGAGKWKKYMTKGHVDILKRQGYDKLLREFGYGFDLTPNDSAEAATVEYEKKYDLFLSLHDYVYYSLFGVNPVYKHADSVCMDRVDLGLKFLSNEGSFQRAADHMLSNDYCKKIINSL